MLLRFTIENFLSFNEEQEFSMNTGAVTTFDERVTKLDNQSVLKFSAVYGANASGKTNLIRSIDFAKQVILVGIENINYQEMHYKLNPKNIDMPTKFEFDLMIDEKCYGYGFTVNLKEKKVLNEWLVELNKKEDLLIFERASEKNYYAQDIEFTKNEEKEKFNLQLELSNEIENVLLISEIARRKSLPNELNILKKIYDWFKNELVIIYPNIPIEDMTNVFKNSDKRLVELLKYFDTGISDYILAPSSFEQIQKYLPKAAFDEIKNSIDNTQKVLKEMNKENLKGILRLNNHLFEVEFDSDNDNEFKMNEILFKHNDADIIFTFGEESDGTKRLIELLDVIHNDSKNRTIFIDELDRSLHPQMTMKFVETFLKHSENWRTQLIITTHESNLMDLKLLRRDEIWFVERDAKKNESKLYSLEKFKVHNTKKVAKDYLIGRYGAVPVFKDFDSYIGGSDD